MVSKTCITSSNRVVGASIKIEAYINLMVQLEEILETTYYYVLKYGRKPISNEEGTIQHKVCLIFNYIIIGGIVFCL